MTDIEVVRCALNAVADEHWNAWDAFNRIVGELARLRAENKHLRETNSGRPSSELYEAHTAELRAEVEALREDAERYRWLRDTFDASISIWLQDGPRRVWLAQAELDDAIDAARSKT